MTSTARWMFLSVLALLPCQFAGPVNAGDYDGIGGYGMPSKLSEGDDEDGAFGYRIVEEWRGQKGDEENINGSKAGKGTTTIGTGNYPFWRLVSRFKALDLSLAKWMTLIRAR